MAFYDNIDTTKKFRFGTRKKDVAGNEYVYLPGCTNGADGAWVTVGASWATTLTAADAQGMVAVMNSVLDATTKYGWCTIYGMESALVLASFDGTNGAGIYLTSTAGSVDDSDVAGDAVHGAIGLTDRDTTTGMSTVFLNYPFVLDLATD